MKIKALFTPLLLGFLLLISSAGIDARQLFSNNGSSTLSAALTDVGTSMAVVTGEGALFESPTGGDYELITLTDGTNVEIVKATARSTDTLTIARAQEGTTAQAWAAGTVAQGRLTAATLDQFPQLDNGGNTKGSNAVNLQPGRLNVAHVASGSESLAAGYDSQASGTYSVAVGAYSYVTATDGTAIGDSATVTGAQGVAVGVASTASGADAIAVGSNALASGAQSLAAGNYNHATGLYSVCTGYSSTASAEKSVMIGSEGLASAAYATALGGDAIARIPYSNVISGASLLRKDNGETAGNEHIYYTGSQAVIFSKEIDLTATAADDVSTITVPTGATFFPDEIGLIVTAADTVTGQPSISFGVTGNTVALLASTATTKSAIKGRDIFTLLSNDGVNSLTASVKAAATATTLKGRFYWKGILVEDE